MKHTKSLIALLLALSLLLTLLAGCGGQAPDADTEQPSQQTEEPSDVPDEPAPAPEPELEPEPEPDPDPVELALEQYRTIVGQADTYDYGSIDEPTGEYRYALVRMVPEDTVPTLLLEQGTTFGIYHALAFRYDADGKNVAQAADTLMEGEATVGGLRGSLAMMADGNGIRALEMYSGSGDVTISRVTMGGSALVTETAWEGQIDQMPDEIGRAAEIAWHDVSDTGVLDSWTPPVSAPAEPEPTEPEPAELPTDGDRIVFRGTLNSYTYNEVVALQDQPDPNAEYADTSAVFWLIQPSEPQDMSLGSSGGGGFTEGTVGMISATYAQGLESLKQYEGQELIFSIDPNTTWWPSDTSLPIGKPLAIGEIHVLQ